MGNQYGKSIVETINDFVEEVAKKHHEAIEELTREQFEDALIGAIKSGDFVRCVEQARFDAKIYGSGFNMVSKQGFSYIPYREVMRLKEENSELRERLSELEENQGEDDERVR